MSVMSSIHARECALYSHQSQANSLIVTVHRFEIYSIPNSKAVSKTQQKEANRGKRERESDSFRSEMEVIIMMIAFMAIFSVPFLSSFVDLHHHYPHGLEYIWMNESSTIIIIRIGPNDTAVSGNHTHLGRNA